MLGKLSENNCPVKLKKDSAEAIRELIKKSAVAADIFIFLSQHMNEKNAVVCPSKVLEDATGKSRVTISRAISKLKKEGYLCVLKAGTTNVYILNHHVILYANQVRGRHYEFEGPILISTKENPELDALIDI